MSVLSIGELLGIGPSELSGLVPYSAIEGSGGNITGINGSGVVGNYSSKSATVLVSGQNLEGTKSAVVSSVEPGINITSSGYTFVPDYNHWRTSQQVLTSVPTTSTAFLSFNYTAEESGSGPNQKPMNLTVTCSGIHGSSTLLNQENVSGPSAFSGYLSSTGISSVTLEIAAPQSVYYSGFTAGDITISSETTTAWERIELAGMSDISALSNEVSSTVNNLSGSVDSAINNMVINVNNQLDGAKFRTGLYNNATQRTGVETDFKVMYDTANVAFSASSFPPINGPIKQTGYNFLADHDTGGYADWFFTAGTGYIEVTGNSYAEWRPNSASHQKFSVVASGFCHDSADHVTARAMSAYGEYWGGGYGYLLENGVEMYPSFTAANGGYLWTASASGAVPYHVHGMLVPYGFSGTAVIGVGKFDFHPESGDKISAWVTLDEWTGSTKVVSSTDFCVVPSYDKFNQLWNWATANGFTP